METPETPQQAAQRRLNALLADIGQASTFVQLLGLVRDQLVAMFGVERLTLFAYDGRGRQLYSVIKTGSDLREIRVPLTDESIAGFVGLRRQGVNLPDVYDTAAMQKLHPKLSFDPRWDQTSGFQTRSMICVPLVHEDDLVGVLQLVNRLKDGAPVAFRHQHALLADAIGRVLAGTLFRLAQKRELPTPRRASQWQVLLDMDKAAISEAELEQAEAAAARAEMDVARYLIERVKIPRALIERSLSTFYRCDFFRFTGEERIPESIVKKVKAEFFKNLGAAPVEIRRSSLLVVIDDPLDLPRLDSMRHVEPRLRIEPLVGLRDEILRFIEASYAAPAAEAEGGLTLPESDLAAGLSPAVPAPGDGDEEDARERSEAQARAIAAGRPEFEPGRESESVVVRLLEQIVRDACQRGASDIHIEPNAQDEPTLIRMRVDGGCVLYQQVRPEMRDDLAARIKILAGLDAAERRRPQEGKLRLQLDEGLVELRVAVIPTCGGDEDVVLRVLGARGPLPLPALGLSPRNLEALTAAAAAERGLLLCVGPTGAGKTTTLHSVLRHLNRPEVKIWTAEDPVEITQRGLRQIQVQPRVGYGFAAALRAMLLGDPDVILVGELRDQETAALAVEAALGGHLVLSALHCAGAEEAILRLFDMGLDPFHLADALEVVLTQRLARRLCLSCREEIEPEAGEVEQVRAILGHGVGAGEKQVRLFRGRGCGECQQSGYRGRVALHEVLVASEAVRRAIMRRAPAAELRRIARVEGMITLYEDGVRKAMAGMTDLRQVLSACGRHGGERPRDGESL